MDTEREITRGQTECSSKVFIIIMFFMLSILTGESFWSFETFEFHFAQWSLKAIYFFLCF